MIKVVAKNFVKKGNEEEFLVLAKKLIEQTTQNDEGCISYELFQDVNDLNLFTIMEAWENKDVLDQHMAAKHFQQIIPQLGKLMDKPGEINVYKKVE
jgi:quinol monooxygenase YgiN